MAVYNQHTLHANFYLKNKILPLNPG